MDTQKVRPPLTIERFLSGIITRRNALYPPFRSINLQIAQFHDVLIDGLNVECSDLFTLQRRPGFAPWTSTPLNYGEIANQFFSFRNLPGTVYPLVDTNQRVALLDSNL